MKIKQCTSAAAIVLAWVVSTSAQLITYVDATDGASGNTTLTNGSTWSPQTANQGTSGDGLWARRAFANAATIYQNAANGNTDNAHRLVTTIGSLPAATYDVFAYMWMDSTPAGWRMEVSLVDNPGGELPLYTGGDPGTVQFYSGGDATVLSSSLAENPFTTDVMVAEGNRRLIQISLGQITGTGFQVYIDDDPNMSGSNQRTWYDGVGYALADFTGQISVPEFLANGDLRVRYLGTAGGKYVQESTDSLVPTIEWTPGLQTNTADSEGLVMFTNTPADSQAFYRVHDVTQPAQVMDLMATAGIEQVMLSWTESVGATGYNIKRSGSSGGPHVTIAGSGETNFADTGVVVGTPYYYVVSATNFNGESADSAEASATPLPPPPPNAPTGLMATAGNAVVLLDWAASVDATSYNLKRSVSGGGPYASIANVSTTSFLDMGVANGTTYYYVASAQNVNGESDDSPEVSATPEALPPLAPTGLAASGGNEQVLLSWTASFGATSYNIKRSATSGSGYVTITNVTEASFVDTNVVNDTPYYYLVSALNADGESTDSSEAGATPSAVIPLVYDVENTGADFPAPPLPVLANLPFVQALPDPFMWSATDPYDWTYPAGRSTNFYDWSQRRSEIKTEIEFYEIGYRPPVDPSMIFASVSGSGTSRTLTVRTTNIVNGVTRTLTQTVNITLPASSGTFAALIGFNGAISIPLGGRPIATINYQIGQLSTYGNPQNSNPYYALYAPPFAAPDPFQPDINIDTTGQYSAWSWGCSRLLDGLHQLGGDLGGGVQLNLERIGVTGCSYAGKGALFCGAFDERIVLTIPQESGGGGVPNWRYSGTEPSGSVEWIPNTDYNWFKEDMRQFGGASVSYLPEDHHELMAMVAPRALFATANPQGAVWLSNPSAYVSFKAVERIYEGWGIGDRFGYNGLTGANHCGVTTLLPEDSGAFLDKFLLGMTNVNTITNRHVPDDYVTIDYGAWTEWWGTTNPVLTGTSEGTYTNTYEPECAAALGTNWITVADAQASNGKYVTLNPALPQGDLGNPPPTSAGWIEIAITVPTNGSAYVFGRVNCPTADDDSFWIRVDGGSWTMLNGLNSSGWVWQPFANYDLTAGAHTITIGHRENGALLDKISISDFQFPPTDTGVPAALICP